jgi:signal transduction histidine kinase
MVMTSELQIELDVDLAYEREEGSTRLTPEIENAVYRMVQEALTNVAKHAATDRAAVAVHESAGRIDIEIRDEGAGFDPGGSSGGFGLIGMRERADLVDGTVTVRSTPGRGTTVSIVVPAKHLRRGPPIREPVGSPHP